MNILLTNDDGIDAVGIRTLYDRLSPIADVMAVAPANDQSAVGRQLSQTVDLYEHELGYAVEGTPGDCVIAALGSLDFEPDLVVSGTNQGANLGAYVLGRSGTVSAAVEAAFFNVPAIAASVYFPAGQFDFDEFTPEPAHFGEAARAVEFLVEHASNVGVFETADYLNVNAPLPPATGHAKMEITRPSHVYKMDADHDGNGTVRLNDRIWELMAEGSIPDPVGSDRRAVIEGRVSVSPLTAPHTTTDHEALVGLAEAY
ncbi:5'/3'-nucleotidase SurE [Natronomonas salsuginis]|jgi:5'-nucleotidase|uniref:5'-nucleotidase SurE n=1 Tax=Natronomonas salsuginis TaxID=2217661 RepID=A0A4U5JB58_9EURY|nr:5'/3'-nucleotidase SurE [Natronomonas salsuginis]TKR26430.1 5'/3'-nucleotidase SurE [Natronomonas salsuginis]